MHDGRRKSKSMKQKRGQAGERLQMSSTGSRSLEGAAAPSVVGEVLLSPGRPIDCETRAFMEPIFGHDFSQVRVKAAPAPALQTKLAVNQPGDQYEQEADQVADNVLRMAAPGTVMAPATPDDDKPEDEILLRKERNGAAALSTQGAPPIVNEVLSAWPSNSSLEAAIELRNLSASPVNLSFWYLSNQRHLLQKYQLTNGTVLPANGFAVVLLNTTAGVTALRVDAAGAVASLQSGL